MPKANADKYDAYFLGIAGYAQQEVFRRELTDIEKVLAKVLGVGRRSVLLVNSQRSLAMPLATVNSIEKSLQAIAKNMNQQQDLLVVYATSHGSKDHQLSLEHKGVALKDLPAKRLAEMLDATGIKHQLIIISACYSGGFINELKAPNRMIITAAAADKTSFGCSDNKAFTYFGQAFFKESLTEETSFVEAFDNASTLVTKWEKAQGYEPSQPQISKPAAIVDYLQRFRKRQNNNGLANEVGGDVETAD